MAGRTNHQRGYRGNRSDDGGGVGVTFAELMRLRIVAANLRSPNPDAVAGLLPGLYRSLFRGRGLDFEEVRAYQQGDDFRLLDWRVTARTGRPHTKVFQEEREHTLFLCFDLRPSMHFGTRNSLKWVAAAKAAAVIAWVAVDNGDRIGGMVFGAGDQCFVERPLGGRPGAIRLFRLLERVSGERTTGSQGEFSTILARIHQLAPPGSLIMLFSDFQGFGADAQRQLSYLARDHDLASVFVFDPLERELPPPGRYSFSDGTRRVVVDTGDRRLRRTFRRRFEAHRLALRAHCSRYGVRFGELATDQPLIATIRAENFRIPSDRSRTAGRKREGHV